MINNYKFAIKLVRLYKWFMIGADGRKLTRSRLKLYLKIYDLAHMLISSESTNDKNVGILLMTINKAFELEHKEVFERYEKK